MIWTQFELLKVKKNREIEYLKNWVQIKCPAMHAIRDGILALFTVRRYVMNADFSYNYKETAIFIKNHHHSIYISY
jgi:hypothetical protein